MSDEEDYMSEDFFKKCTQTDIRPGLNKTLGARREHEMLKKRTACVEEQQRNRKEKKSRTELEMEKREEGLATSIIDSSNKGFALLAKMGYKQGERLGKDQSGRLEPVQITFRQGRGGLGRDTAIKAFEEQKQRILEERAARIVADFDPLQFRAQMREKHLAKRTESDLVKAQKSCRELDQKKDFDSPAEQWFWPKEPKLKEQEEDAEEEEEEEEEEELFSPSEKLEMLVTYLRTEHLYCLFCGISYEDTEDMEQNCPGPGREDHDDL